MKKISSRSMRIAVLAVLLCMLLFTSTALCWTYLTDSSALSTNTVEAGTLDVSLEMKENGNWVDAEGKTLDFTNENGNKYWEPGGSYTLPEIRVINNGNLDLKYTIKISGVNGDSKLEEVIDWYQISGDNKSELSEIKGTLVAGESSSPFTIMGTMDAEASNDYQGLSIEGISIEVSATQTSVQDNEVTMVEGQPYYTVNTNENLIIDEKGKTIVFDDTEQNYLASENGQKITYSNATITGTTEALLFGQYRGPSYTNYNNEINNLNVVNLNVINGVKNGSDAMSIGVYSYGTSVYNNCTMVGTTSSVDGYGVYDFGTVNGSKTTINGGKYGSMYIWSQAHVNINNAEVDKIVCSTITTRNLGMLTVSKGTHVGTIELTCAGYKQYKPALTIKNGATVDKIIYKGVTYTQEEWLNNNPL